MSNRHLSIVRGLDIKGPARAVLLALADRADDKGVSWPSWKTLQRESGFSRSAIHCALRALKKDGCISWTHRKDESGDLTSNLYLLTVDGGSPPDGRGSPPDGLGVVRETDGGSPGDGRRSVREASSESIREASLFCESDSPMAETIISKKESQQQLAESIYEKYPKKVAKPSAIKAILKALKKRDHEFLIEKTKAYASAIGWRGQQFIPHPATWFNQEGFNDDPETWEPSSPTTYAAPTGRKLSNEEGF